MDKPSRSTLNGGRMNLTPAIPARTRSMYDSKPIEVALHYFDQDKADSSDTALSVMIKQGHVPPTCLMGGPIVECMVKGGHDPCGDCGGPREKCKGRGKVKRRPGPIDRSHNREID